MRWFHKAAEQGCYRSQFELGMIYAYGNSWGIGGQDVRKAYDLFHKAAEQGFTQAQCWLSRMYFNGSTAVPRDYARAAMWCEMAADRGDSNACVELASLYALGFGMPQDDQLAVAWLHKAIEEYESEVHYFLSFMYAHGRGVPQDDQMAVAYLGKAAEWGDIDAQRALGVRYHHGLGVSQDHQMAAMWFHRAARREKHEAQLNLRADPSPEQDRDEPIFKQSARLLFRQSVLKGNAGLVIQKDSRRLQ